MPEIKHTFTGGKMNKDLDERLILNGEYRDAMNIQVSTSEGSDVGAVQNILGNSLVFSGPLDGETMIPPGSHCIGSVADEKNDALYWLITQENQFSYTDFTDGVFQSKDMILQYKNGNVVPVLVDLSNTYILMPGGGNPITGDIPISTLTGWNAISVGDTVSSFVDVFTGNLIEQESFIVLSKNSGNQTINIGDYTNASSSFVNAQQGEIYFRLNEVNSTLNFSIKPNLTETYGEPQLITGINIIDDMLFWTDNYSEPKKINIPRCIEGTHPLGHQHTLFINEDRGITTTQNPTQIREEHITVIKKAPLLAPVISMLAARPGNTFGAIGDGVGGAAINIPIFAGLTTGDPVILQIESVNSAGLNYNVDDVLILKEGNDQSSDFPLDATAPDVRVVIKTIDNTTYISNNGKTIYYCECELLSVRSDLSVSANIFGVDLDTSYEKLYELKFPRFSTRFKYIDGEYSSFGPFSEIAFIPGTYDYFPNKGYNLGMENNLRELTLRRIVPRNIPDGVVQIDILYKESNSPSVYTVDSIKQTDPWGGRGGNYWTFNEYKITKDIIHAVLPENQLLRLWDNVPRRALAQDIIGNRIVYGNYLQGFNLLSESYAKIKSSFKVFLETRLDKTTYKSIKSIRNYQMGIVYLDEYNRQTPILTDSSGTLAVSKLDGSKTNQIVVEPKNDPPIWAKYHKFYVKETSNEYYNLSLDRYFDAKDGNIWLSFPSNDRDKIDLETSLYLKKKYNSDVQETTLNKYKVIDIKNEAPEYIQTRRVTIGTISNDDKGFTVGTPGNPGVFFYNPSVASGNTYATDRWPIEGEDKIRFHATALTDSILENFHIKHTSFYGNMSPKNPLYVKFVAENSDGDLTGDSTNWYEVDEVNRKGHSLITGVYRIKLKNKIGSLPPPFDGDADWLNNGTAAAPELSTAASNGDVVVHIAQDIVQNKAVFQGRFFVKIERDSYIEEAIVNQGAFQNIQTIVKADCYYLKDFTEEDLSSGAITSLDNQKNNATMTSGVHSGMINSFNNQGAIINSTGTWSMSNLLNPSTSNPSQLPDGKPIPTDAYWSREIWYEIYERLKNTPTESRWFIDEAFATGEEPLWGAHGKQRSQEFLGAPHDNVVTSYNQGLKSSTLYGGYSSDSSHVHTLDHNSISGLTSIDVQGLGHGSTTRDYEYFTQGKAVTDYTIDISYLGPGDSPNSDYKTLSLWYPAPSPLGVPDYEDYWSIMRTFDPVGRKFADHLVEGNQLRFTNDPEEVVWKIKNVEKFYKLNYAEAEEDFFYPNAETINVVTGCLSAMGFGHPQLAECVSNGYEYWNNAPWNRRITYRLTLQAPNAGNVIGFNGYTPLASGNIGATSWDAPTAPGVSNENPCGIEIVTTNYVTDSDIPFPENPAVFETEPKENVDLEIYHEASDNIPITLSGNGYEFAPIGSKVTVPSASSTIGAPAVVVGWDGNVVELSNPVNDCTVNQGDLFYFEKHDGTFTSAEFDGLVNPISGPCDSSLFVRFSDNIHNVKVGLGWHNCYSFGNGVESNRIRDTFNSPIIDKGPRVSSILEKTYTEDRRKYGLIYSGLYNSTSDTNNLNQFIQAEKITKDINPIHGSIQKLHTRDTDLVTLCEDKVLRILANKDAVYNADGNPQLVATQNVLGQTVPFVGEFGISKNPESFASESYRSYFTDKQRGAVMRLSKDGLTPISNHGMKDWFRDNLKLSNQLIGSYDDRNDEYNITLKDIAKTVSFKEDVRGWVSFKSFIPENAISCANEYFTILDGQLYKHYIEILNPTTGEDTNRNTFYREVDPPLPNDGFTASSVNVILNESPGSVKSFHTLDYEGSQSQIIPMTFYDTGNQFILEDQYYNLTAKDGWYVESAITDLENGSLNEFIEKEGKWFNYFHGKSITTDVNGFVESNYDTDSFAVQGIGYPDGVVQISGCTDPTMFNYDPNAIIDDGSCVPIISGCNDPLAMNYNPLVNTPLISDCEYCVYGCMDPAATNYNPLATCYDPSDPCCLVLGCTDPNACNYNPLADCDDGSCYGILGCIDPLASNYNPLATCDCDGTIGGTEYICCDYGIPTPPATGFAISGCMDNTTINGAGLGINGALNYNSNATADCAGVVGGTDYSCCKYCVYGCTDPLATNYNPLATCDDGSCTYITTYPSCSLVSNADFSSAILSNTSGEDLGSAMFNSLPVTTGWKSHNFYDDPSNSAGNSIPPYIDAGDSLILEGSSASILSNAEQVGIYQRMPATLTSANAYRLIIEIESVTLGASSGTAYEPTLYLGNNSASNSGALGFLFTSNSINWYDLFGQYGRQHIPLAVGTYTIQFAPIGNAPYDTEALSIMLNTYDNSQVKIGYVCLEIGSPI